MEGEVGRGRLPILSRNLRTLEVDLDVLERMAGALPESRTDIWTVIEPNPICSNWWTTST